MDTVFTATERAALRKQVVYSDFAAAPAMIFDCEVHALKGRGFFWMSASAPPPTIPGCFLRPPTEADTLFIQKFVARSLCNVGNGWGLLLYYHQEAA